MGTGNNQCGAGKGLLFGFNAGRKVKLLLNDIGFTALGKKSLSFDPSEGMAGVNKGNS